MAAGDLGNTAQIEIIIDSTIYVNPCKCLATTEESETKKRLASTTGH